MFLYRTIRKKKLLCNSNEKEYTLEPVKFLTIFLNFKTSMFWEYSLQDLFLKQLRKILENIV